MKNVHVETLPTSKAFFPTVDRSWLVNFWDIDVADIFLAIPFAILLTILFYFDHNGTIPTAKLLTRRSINLLFSFFIDRPRDRVSAP